MNRLLVALVGAMFGWGCGGSDQTGANNAGGSMLDASTTTGTGGAAGSSAPAGDSSTSPVSESGFDFDGFPIPDGPIGACATCIRDMCQADLATCATNPQCQMGVICSLQNCGQYAMGEAGAAGLLCITTCFGDLQTALQALNGLSCVTTMCDSCTALLDGGGVAPIDGGGNAPPDSSDTAPPDSGGSD